MTVVQIVAHVSDGFALAFGELAARTRKTWLRAPPINLLVACDELRLHVVPVMLGGGTRLFAESGPRVQLRQISALVTVNATHLAYRVVRLGTPDDRAESDSGMGRGPHR
ncbi:MAG: hypothetical protein ACT4PJ_13880 [Gemmatimonadaceae bacterium]